MTLKDIFKGCGLIALAATIIALFLLCSCSTTKEITTESHSYSMLTDKMDSLLHSTSVWQEEFLSRQTSLIETFSQKEKNDSSYSVTINEKGDTVRERLVIIREVEKDHSTEKEVYDVLMRQYNRIDSLLKVSLDKQAETDSLLQQKQTEVEVPADLSWWQKAKMEIGGWAMLIIAGVIVFFAIKYGRRLYQVYKFF